MRERPARFRCFMAPTGALPARTVPLDTMREVADLMAAEAHGSQRPGAVAIQIVDTTDCGVVCLQYGGPERSVHIRHITHPKPPNGGTENLRAFFMMIESLTRAVRKFMGRQTGDRWTPLPDGPRQRRGAERLWRLYQSFYRTQTLRLCEKMRERDTAANQKLNEMARFFANLGYHTGITPAEEATPDDIRMVNMIDRLSAAQSGEELATALTRNQTKAQGEQTHP